MGNQLCFLAWVHLAPSAHNQGGLYLSAIKNSVSPPGVARKQGAGGTLSHLALSNLLPVDEEHE